MNSLTIYHLSLVVHIAGLTMMAGTTLTDYVLFKQFWKQFALGRPKGIAIREATSKLPVLFGIGILLLILSGVSMMAITHGAFGEQLWFRIKFGLVILVIINGLAIGRRQGLRLDSVLSEDGPGNNASASDHNTGRSDKNADARLIAIRKNLSSFHLTQLLLFIIIFVLSVFKFN